MTVDQPKVVDIVSINKDGEVVLTISDHLDWDDSDQHQLILQTKLNTYLAFIESGEIYEKYPNATNRKIVISIVSKYPPDRTGNEFLAKVKEIVEKAGFGFSFRQFAINPDFIF